jgi:hypothetical protein
MADKKISALTASTTPLAGTEVLPIVQSGATVKVAVSDLTSGRAVSMANLFLQSATLPAAGNPSIALRSADNTVYHQSGSANATVFLDSAQNTIAIIDKTTGVSVYGANFVVGTSGKGIDFSATPGTGTSELLDDYEEGTWTATIFNGANNATMGDGGTCQYTKIGRLVTLHGYLYTTSLGSVTGDLNISGLPFTTLAGGSNFTASAAGFGDSLALVPGQSIGIRFAPNSTNAALVVWDAITGSTVMQDTEWTSNGELMFTATYLTAS